MQGRAAGAVRGLNVSVLPPDLPRLRTLVTYLRGELSRTEQALAAAEEREAATAREQPAPERPAWLVERGIGVGRLPVRVHTGDCWDTGKRCVPAAPDQVRRLLAEGVAACIHCRPDTALGVLE
uniref:SLV.2 n=1 Tax=Streptomyces lavendulae TaxID=1914 RepID=Q6RGR8_STRLA|nr:SLV.2 [Streptomyces lavendulae]